MNYPERKTTENTNKFGIIIATFSIIEKVRIIIIQSLFSIVIMIG